MIPRGARNRQKTSPGSRTEALAKWASDKHLAGGPAALEAIALRGDASLLPKISAALDDDKDVVRFTSAACVARLSGQPGEPGSSNARKP